MKRKFTILLAAALLLMSGLTWGQTRTQIHWVASEQGYSNGDAIESVTFDDNVSATFNKGTNGNAPKYYNTGSAIRCYGGNFFTITTTEGNLTEIALSFGSGDGSNAISTDVGTYEAGTWTGSAASVTFTIGGSTGHRRISAFDITYSGGGGVQTVATPTFSPAAGTFTTAQTVSISCTTQGATIHYTMDGSTPTANSTTYSSPLAISETTTIKAMAMKTGMNNSNVATATYNIVQASTLTTIGQIWDFAENVGTTATPANVTFNNWYVSGVKGGQAIITDGQYGFVIYQSSHGFNVGDKLNGTVSCNVLLYQNHYAELTGVKATDLTVTANQEVPVLTTTIGSLTTRNYGTPINLGTLTYDGTKFNDDSGAQITPYNNFNLDPNPITSLVANTQYNVKGVYIIYWQNGNPVQQVAPRNADDFEEITSPSQTVATPTFSPAAGTYTEAQNVTISCATAGATIHYTLDGSTPTANSATYSTPIAISQTTTVKAIAMKQGMNNSNVATAEYTIVEVSTLTTIAQIWDFAESVGTTATQANVTFNNWYVSGVKGGQAIITDGQYGFVIYQNSHGFNAGDKLSGTVTCNVLLYQNHYAELTGVQATDLTVTANQEVPVLTTTIDALVVRNYGALLNLGTLTYTGNVFQDESGAQITPYNNFNLSPNPVQSLVANNQYNVKGVSIVYWQNGNAVQQIAPRSANDFEDVTPTQNVATPIISPEAGDYNQAITVTITCATEGATIYYTTNGQDPYITEAGVVGTLYENPFELSNTTTVSALAIKDGMGCSEIATAVYNINIVPPAQETEYTLITNANALVAGDKYIVVGIKSDAYKALGKQATNNRVAVDVTPSNNVITVTPANQSGMDAVYELTLGQENNYWTLYDAATGGYLYAASSTANQLKVQDENDANGQWTIEVASDGVATIKAQGGNTRNWLRLNNSGSPFSCYGSGQLDVYLYKAGEVPPVPYFTVNVAETSNGSVTVNKTSALVNDTIFVTATPDNNYELTTLTYNYTGSNPISIMDTRWFLMPNADVTVNAVFTELAHVAAPTFNPSAGSFITAQEVTLACATEGATIYYTLDGTDPTVQSTEYTEPFTVSSTTTVKAFAVKAEMTNSEISSATYTIIEPITIAQARNLALNEYALVQGVVTFIDGRNVYVQDETAGIVLYLNNNTVPEALAIGDMVLGYGKRAVYNGLAELSGINGGNANQFVIVNSNNQLPVAEKTIAEILADHEGDKMLQSSRVQIVNATIGTINNANNTPITQDGNTLNIYKLPVVQGLEQGDIVTVTGVIGCYNNPQLRVNAADDVTFTHPAGITVNPTALSGFNYVYEEGPSTAKSFVITARSLTSATHITAPESYELSSFPGENFYPENEITINSYTGTYSYTIKVRLKAGLETGSYNESITIAEEELDTIYIALSGSVTAQPQPGSEYTRVTDLSQIGAGSKVIFAARFDENVNDYYAMTAQASGKPEGVLFTSTNGTNGETLPTSITDAEDTYYWTVDANGSDYTFTNANGDVLGYTSSTNFATGGDNTAWAITYQTSGESAMVPNYSGFVVNNVNNPVRAIALNGNHNYGPYHTQNMNGENYNFYLDMFVTGGGTLTCAVPTFTPEGGIYYETQEVVISCTTPDATIYYTLDGSEPTVESDIYDQPIAVTSNTTIKAFAVKEGFNDSNIATAEYTLILGAVTIFYQDWEGEMNGWTFVTVEGSKPWIVNQYQGNHYAYANGYNGGANEQWCISPAFNLNNYEGVTLTFRNAMNYTGPDLELYFSNNYDGTNPAATTWIELEFNKSTGGFAWVESGAISLADFEGESCYIGFKYISTDDSAAAWEIDDITLVGLTSDPTLTTTTNSLSGFSYMEGNGPSAEQSFTIMGMNLSEDVIITIEGEGFEMSDLTGDDFDPIEEFEIEPYNSAVEQVIYVRLAEGLEAGDYTGTITVTSELDDITISLSGHVNEEVQGGDWNRIASLADLHDGDQLVIAARYDATVGDGYYAMTASVTNKPEGVLFTSVNNNGVETLPDEIVADITTFVWTVTLNDTIITFTNTAGDVLGYSGSGTNFAGNTSTDWTIRQATSGENAMVPNYTGFLITNFETTNRFIAENSNHNFGPYHINNINSADYNFYLDLFVQGGTSTPTVATPVFSMASGTYMEEIDVEISCATEGATIYYTTDGTDPTSASDVYTEPIHVDQDMTIKAIATLEGYDDSGIATANYVIHAGITVIFSQDWEGEMNGWSFITVEGNKPWNIGTYNNNHYAYANGYGDDVDNEQWCLSPWFNLNNYDGVTLTFRNATKFNGPALELLFSNDFDGQDLSTGTWHPLSFNQSPGNYTWVESGEISLDGFSGGRCYIAFRYTSAPGTDNAAAWEIDDIMLMAGTTSVSEISLMEVNLWNNGNEITVENNTESNLQMVVFNVLGQQVLSKTITTGSVRFSHNLNQGVYIVTLQNNKERMASKIIVR